MSPMLKKWICLDVASAPIADAAAFLEGTIKAPSNYRDPVKIAEYVAEKEAERLAMAATDLDLARVTCFALHTSGTDDAYSELTHERLMQNEREECDVITALAGRLDSWLHKGASIVTFGGHRFDLPLLMRRARYLGVEFPRIDLDRYRSTHIDLCELLSDRDAQRRRSLDFYVKRLGWSDLLPKPMDGAEEAQIFTHGRWDDLRRSVARDVEAVRRLAVWEGVLW